MPVPLPSNLVALLPRDLDPNVVTAHALLAGAFDGAPGESLLLVHAGRPVLLTRDAHGKPFSSAPLDGDQPLRIVGDALKVATGGRERAIALSSWLDRELAKSFVSSPGASGSVSFGLAHPAPAPVAAPAPASAPAPAAAPVPVAVAAPVAAPAPVASGSVSAPVGGGYQLRLAPYDGRLIIMAIKLVRELTNEGLAQAKNLVEQGGVILPGATQQSARDAAAKLTQVGCRVTVEALS